MEFLRPNFLWALFLIAIPVIVHLFYFRRYKKVYFSSLRFLKSVKEEQSTWRKIRNLLVLLARIGVIAFLVFAFAQPFIPTGDQKAGDRAVSIYIDNSFSMNARSEAVNLVEEAKKRAMEIVQAQDAETRFQIVSNEFQVNSARWVNREEASKILDEIQLRPEVRNLDVVLSYQTEAFKKTDADQHVRFLISDFQRSTTRLPNDMDTAIQTIMIPMKAIRSGNVAIDSVWLEAPVIIEGQSSRLYVKLTNYGSQDVQNVRLSIFINNENRPFGQRDIPANSSLVDTVLIRPISSGWQEATVKISDYPVQFDDDYFITFNVPEEVSVLVLHQDELDPYLRAALEGIPSIGYKNQNVSQVNYAEFSNYDLIISQDLENMSSGMQNSLSRYLSAGGNVLVFPSVNSDLSSYNSFLTMNGARPLSPVVEEEAEVFQLEEKAFLFSDVFESQEQRVQLPKTNAYFKPTGASTVGEQVLLRLRRGSSYLSQFNVGNGYLFLSYAPMERKYNSLSTDGEIFVPLLFRASLISAENNQLSYVIGESNSFSLKKEFGLGEADYRVEGAVNFIPLQRNLGANMLIDFQQQIKQAGFYDLLAKDTLIRKLAFNYHRSESDLSTYSIGDLQEMIPAKWKVLQLKEGSPIGEKVNQAVSGIELWKWCIILTLVFLAIEQLILRFWKIE